MIKNKTVKRIWEKHKLSILFIYGLNILEEVMYLLIPSSVGLLIDTFIDKKGYGIVAFAVTYIGWQGIAVFRKIKDTITFTKIFNEESLFLVATHHKEKIETTVINARVELMKQVVDFFETDLPFIANSIVSIFGSAVLLYFYNPKLIFAAFIIIIPSILINRLYSKKIVAVTQMINDGYENQVNVIESNDPVKQASYFNTLRNRNIKKSSLEAINFGLLEIFVFIMIFCSIYVICTTAKMNYGSIVASYGIILRFAYGFDFIPHTTTKLATLKDILKRIDTNIIPKK
jgi:ABC-type multidrug transport system fused ATPase/permease subunit